MPYGDRSIKIAEGCGCCGGCYLCLLCGDPQYACVTVSGAQFHNNGANPGDFDDVDWDFDGDYLLRIFDLFHTDGPCSGRLRDRSLVFQPAATGAGPPYCTDYTPAVGNIYADCAAGIVLNCNSGLTPSRPAFSIRPFTGYFIYYINSPYNDALTELQYTALCSGDAITCTFTLDATTVPPGPDSWTYPATITGTIRLGPCPGYGAPSGPGRTVGGEAPPPMLEAVEGPS